MGKIGEISRTPWEAPREEKREKIGKFRIRAVSHMCPPQAERGLLVQLAGRLLTTCGGYFVFPRAATGLNRVNRMWRNTTLRGLRGCKAESNIDMPSLATACQAPQVLATCPKAGARPW